MTVKRAASTLIIFYGLLAQHTSSASSKQAHFGVSRGRENNGNFVSRTNSKSRSSKHHKSRGGQVSVSTEYDGDIYSSRRKKESSHHETERSHLPNNSLSSNRENEPTTESLATEPTKSRLLQIPISVTLQKDGYGGAERAVPISTFLDTGAQVTIMTLNAAKRAGIAHLIDTRYAGEATGVAGVSCRVLGRVPANSVSFAVGDGDDVLDKSPPITILEGGIMGGDAIDMLLGLDVLEDWQAMVCLRDRTLTVRSGCRRSKNKKYVIPFVGSTESQGKQNKKSYGSNRNISSLRTQNNPSPLSKGSVNPFARDSSLLESELDALDESSGRKFGDASQDDDDDDLYDDFFTDDDESYYSSESDVEYGEGSLPLGCDLSGM